MQKRKWLVEKRGVLTQGTVAKIADISRSAYANVERGKGLSVPLAKKIAETLNFKWQLFFEENGHETKQRNETA